LAAPAALYAAGDPGAEAPAPAQAVEVVTPAPGDQPAEPDPADPVPAAQPAAQPSSAPATAPTAGAAPSKRLAATSASATVSIGDNFFSPRQVTVNTGDTVTWRNNGQVAHNVTANDGSFRSGTINPGRTYSNAFSSAGSFSYYCTIHGQGQSGTVTVSSRGGAGGQTGGGGVAGPTEAAAVAAPNAAGSDTFLPATGTSTWVVVLIGVSLLAAGLGLRRTGSTR
jgi:LPXTG-motif cell wall-anchored protein